MRGNIRKAHKIKRESVNYAPLFLIWSLGLFLMTDFIARTDVTFEQAAKNWLEWILQWFFFGKGESTKLEKHLSQGISFRNGRRSDKYPSVRREMQNVDYGRGQTIERYDLKCRRRYGMQNICFHHYHHSLRQFWIEMKALIDSPQ